MKLSREISENLRIFFNKTPIGSPEGLYHHRGYKAFLKIKHLFSDEDVEILRDALRHANIEPPKNFWKKVKEVYIRNQIDLIKFNHIE